MSIAPWDPLSLSIEVFNSRVFKLETALRIAESAEAAFTKYLSLVADLLDIISDFSGQEQKPASAFISANFYRQIKYEMRDLPPLLDKAEAKGFITESMAITIRNAGKALGLLD